MYNIIQLKLFWDIHSLFFQALVSVSQPEGGRVWLAGPRTEKYGQTDTSLGLWAECDTLGDHVTVYDGPGGGGPHPSQPGASPALIRMCRGGRVPEVSECFNTRLVIHLKFSV